MNVAPAPEKELHAKAVWSLANRIRIVRHGRGDAKEELRLKGKPCRVRRRHPLGARYFSAGCSKGSWLPRLRN